MPNSSYLANAVYHAVSSAAHWSSCPLCYHPVACAAHEAPVPVVLFSTSEPAAPTAGDDYFTYDAWADPERLPVLEHGRVSAEEFRVSELEADVENHEDQEGEQQGLKEEGGEENPGVEPGDEEWETDEEKTVETVVELEIEENQLVQVRPNTLRKLKEVEMRGAQRQEDLDSRTEKGKGKAKLDPEIDMAPDPSEDENEKWESHPRSIDADTVFNMTRPSAMFKQGESSTTGARRELSANEQWEIKASMEELDLQLATQTSLRELTAEPQTPVPDTPLITPTAMEPIQDQEQTQSDFPRFDGTVSEDEDTGDISSLNLDSPDRSPLSSKENSSELQSVPEKEALSSNDFRSSLSSSDTHDTKAIGSEKKISTEYEARQTSQGSAGSLDISQTTRKKISIEDGNMPVVKKSDGQLGLSRELTPIPQRVKPLNLSLDTKVLSSSDRQLLKDGKLTPADEPVFRGKVNDIPAEVDNSTILQEGGALDSPLSGLAPDVLPIEARLDSLRPVEDRGGSQVAPPFRHTDKEERGKEKEEQQEPEQNDKRSHDQAYFGPAWREMLGSSEQTKFQSAPTPAPKQKYESLLPPIEDDPGLEGEHDPFNQDDPITKSNTEYNRGNSSGAARRSALESQDPRTWRWIKKSKRTVRFKKEEMPPSVLRLKTQTETLTGKAARKLSFFTGSRNTTGGLNRGHGTLESSREYMRRSSKEKHHQEVLKRHQRVLQKQMGLGNLGKNSDPSKISSGSDDSSVSDPTPASITGEPSDPFPPTAPKSTPEATTGEPSNPHLSTTPETSPRASTGEAPAQFSSIGKYTPASNTQDVPNVPPSEEPVPPVDSVGAHSSNVAKEIPSSHPGAGKDSEHVEPGSSSIEDTTPNLSPESPPTSTERPTPGIPEPEPRSQSAEPQDRPVTPEHEQQARSTTPEAEPGSTEQELKHRTARPEPGRSSNREPRSTDPDPDRITPVSEHKTSPASSVKDSAKVEAKDEEKLAIKDKKKPRVPNGLKPWKWGCKKPVPAPATSDDQQSEHEDVTTEDDTKHSGFFKYIKTPKELKAEAKKQFTPGDPTSRWASTGDRVERWFTKHIGRRG